MSGLGSSRHVFAMRRKMPGTVSNRKPEEEEEVSPSSSEPVIGCRPSHEILVGHRLVKGDELDPTRREEPLDTSASANRGPPGNGSSQSLTASSAVENVLPVPGGP